MSNHINMPTTSAETRQLIQQLHALEAQVKATRMQAEALLRRQLIAEAADRAAMHQSILDETFADDQPDWHDQWEYDQLTIGDESDPLMHRVERS